MFKEFKEYAESEIESVRDEDARLNEEENRIRNRLNEISEIRSKFVIQNDALASYISACAAGFNTCPSCFISKNSTIEMRPAAHDEESDINNDVFECPYCSASIEVEI